MKKEIYLILVLFLVSLVLTGLVFGFDNSLDEDGYIQIYTTNLVAYPILFMIGIFALLSYISFGILVVQTKAEDIMKLWVLAISNFILIFILIILNIIFPHGESTVYPPLSALPEAVENSNNSSMTSIGISWFIQVLFILSIFYVGYLIGKEKKRLG